MGSVKRVRWNYTAVERLKVVGAGKGVEWLGRRSGGECS